jgi:ribonuclease HII
MQLICGVDEVGRGPIAGPVVACAVILGDVIIPGIADSKKLTEKKRELLAVEIKRHAVAWALGRAEVEEIDELNILQASLLAMQRAIAQLSPKADFALVDGNQLPKLSIPAKAIIQGDVTEPAISAASIIAKVSRDTEMIQLAKKYPGYGLEKHKGYPTPYHIQQLQHLGLSDIHRRSFAPCQKVLINCLEIG